MTNPCGILLRLPMADPPNPPDASALLSREETVELVDRARRGDEDAVQVLMARFLPRLRRWASGRMPIALRDWPTRRTLCRTCCSSRFRRWAASTQTAKEACRLTCDRPC